MKYIGYCPICEVEIKVKIKPDIYILNCCPICKHHLIYKTKEEIKNEYKTEKEISKEKRIIC